MKHLSLRRQNLLNELLSLPNLLDALQALPASDFHQIILHTGLEDCGELVAMATSSQLEELFDADLWHNTAPGEIAHFDSNRFVRWLDILLEAGENTVMEKICEMDGELLLYAMASQLLVLSSEELAQFFSGEDDDSRQVDILLDSCMYEELYEFQVISRNPETWDTLLTILVALDKEHHDLVCTLLEQLAKLGSAQVEDESLYTVLAEIESMAENMRDKRDTRRGAKGFVSSPDARAFLGLADVHTVNELLSAQTRDAITNAYFRTYSPQQPIKSNQMERHDIHSIIDVLRRHIPDLTAVGVAGALKGDTADNQTMFQLALQQLNANAPKRYQQRMSELSYLGNVVAAGCTLHGKRFRSVDASRAVLATCTLGIDVALYHGRHKWSVETAMNVIDDLPMERLFLAGFKYLSKSVKAPRDYPYLQKDAQTGMISFFDSMADLALRCSSDF
ncbi:MAG: hypothetical protein JXX14_01585 [Deltaproteobacteria bacterium]|nr:hypothetical protein [Deltaproteobacteria bacterium]